MHNTTIAIVIILYFIAIFFMLRLLQGKYRIDNRIPFFCLLSVLLALHMWLLYKKIFLYSTPLISFALAISMAAWISVMFYFCLSIYRKVYELGIIVLPIGLFGVLLEEVISPSLNHATLLDPLLSWHVLVAIPTYGAMCLAFAQAVLLRYQDQRLKVGAGSKLFSFSPTLPSLQTMEANLFGLASAGFLLLTISVLIGVQASENTLGRWIVFDHHTIFAVTAWLGFAVLLFGRWVYGWRGKIAANGFIITFSVLIVAYFGSRFVREFLLS